MSQTAAPAPLPARPRPAIDAASVRFPRATERRLALGVARGFGERFGVDVLVVRGALVLLTLAGGLGLALYALGALLSDVPARGAETPTAPDALEQGARPGQARDLSVAAITAGVLLVVRSTGLWLGDPVMLPAVAVVGGLVVLGLIRPEAFEHARVDASAAGGGRVTSRRARVRALLGAALVALGLTLVGVRPGVSTGLRVGVFATAVTVIGVAVVVGPWLARAAQEVAEERRERIRSAEREAMAAHLHDSVLQTLALIQRSADDPRRTVTLARQQERELRAWLYGSTSPRSATLADAVRSIADDVEADYGIRVEAVVVGDAPLDDGLSGLVAAVREACVNAAKHSGAAEVAVYVEVGQDGVEAYVRDRGIGFVLATVPDDRRGLARSVVGRVERLGGTVAIDTAPGAGTEVHLRLPRRPMTEPSS